MKIVFMVVVLWFNGDGRVVYEYPMPSWERCQEALKSAIIKVSNGNESEAMAAAYCTHSKTR